MIQRLLLLSVVFFWLSSSSYSQEYTYDGQLTQDDIDQGILYGSPDDIDLMDEGLTYMDQIIVPNDYEATTGCLLVQTREWNGVTGGQCANGIDGTYTFGYGQTVIAQTQDAIAEALKIAGITVVGYRWQWRVKNADTNYYNEQNQTNADPLVVMITVKDKAGNVLDKREWDYSYYIYGWEQKYGMEWFDPFISGDDIDTITLEVGAYDAGYWAGYYGPEFGSASIYSLLVVEPPDPCEQIPIVDPTCEGFIGEAPKEDPAIKELVIIESTGSIPLSEDELSVLESLEEEEETFEEEQPQESAEEEQNNVDALAVARNAEANALADAAATIENTLEATSLSLEQDIATTQQINQQAQNQSQQSMQEAEQSQQLSMDMANAINQSLSSSESTNATEQPMTTLDIVDIDIGTDVSATSKINDIGSTEITSLNTNTQSNQQQESMDGGSDIDVSSYMTQQQQEPMIALEVTVDSFEIAALDNAINDAVMNLIKMEQNIIREQVEESQQEEELNEPVSNEKEDELVAAALAGSDDEDAQAALLGFNPNFRAYQQPQMTDADFYAPKDIYAGQENYDNPNARFFNGASDATHREMVRQQYEGN